MPLNRVKISSKFGPVTSELTGLISERQIRHSQKTGAFSRISPDILDRFSLSFHRMKALYVQMMDLYLIFQFFKGRCHGNQIMLIYCRQTDTTCILCSSPDGARLFRYYLLGGDTVAPSGLLARLCHAFLVYIAIFQVAE